MNYRSKTDIVYFTDTLKVDLPRRNLYLPLCVLGQTAPPFLHVVILGPENSIVMDLETVRLFWYIKTRRRCLIVIVFFGN